MTVLGDILMVAGTLLAIVAIWGVVELVQMARTRSLPAVFAEDGQDGGVLATIAREAGIAIAGSLAADGPAPGQGYADMIAANTLLIVQALR